MSFPEQLLTELAREKQLADRETEVFLALFGGGKTRLEIAERLHVQESAVNSCLTGVYKKFGISIRGPVKESHLKDELKRREAIWQRQQSTGAGDRSSTQSQPEGDLLQQVRDRCRQKILNQHSRMQLLSGEKIGVDQLYVDVWLLHRSPRTYHVSPSKMLESFDLRTDRLGLGNRINRISGFEVANANAKLVIVGKPGAGKTTFLKHLAVDWCKGNFQPNSIAVLIEFRRIRDEKWHLIDAIDKELGLENWEQVAEILQKIKEKETLQEGTNKKIKQNQVSRKNIETLQQNFEKSQQTAEELRQQEKKSQQNIEESKTELEELKDELKLLQKKIQILETEIKTSRHQIEALPNKLNALQQEMEVLQQEMEVLPQEMEVLQQEIKVLRQPVKALLNQGRLLVLMDGLDEVITNELRRTVQDQLRQITEDYPTNQFILTCRTQVMEEILNGFNSVEVADFSMEQVKQFFKNWFVAIGKSNTDAERQWEIFDNAVANSPGLKEFTAIPVLLSLMCLVLHDEGEMPSDMTLLYRRGIKLLLSRWNDQKQIDGWEVGSETYRKLSLEQKEALLTEIAARKFENSKNFVLFEQQEIADHITEFLQLVNFKQGVEVLKAIEAQHGLLIERADELWSFSHLTFQEHFTVQWLTQLPSKTLAEKIANEQWQEVIKQIVKSQQPADNLLRLIKQAIDDSISNESNLQHLLKWLLQKPASYQADDKSTAIRAFHFALTLLTFDFTHNLDLALARAQDLNRGLDVPLARVHAQDLEHAYGSACLGLAGAPDLARTLVPDFDFAPESVNQLEQMMVALPVSSTQNWESFKLWWQANAKHWTKQLGQVRRYYGSINHNLQFNFTQKKQLQRYYGANKFLVDLMNVPGAISNTVRTEIEDTLLLPCEELQNRDL